MNKSEKLMLYQNELTPNKAELWWFGCEEALAIAAMLPWGLHSSCLRG